LIHDVGVKIPLRNEEA